MILNPARRNAVMPQSLVASSGVALRALRLLSSGCVLLLGMALPPAQAALQPQQQAELARNYARLPLSYEANNGQFDAQVRYSARGAGYTLFLTNEQTVLRLQSPDPKQADAVLRSRLLGATPTQPQAEGLQQGRSNYLIGADPAKWRKDVAHYARVRYPEVYPGIDLVYHGRQRQLEYDFVVAPGASPDRIRMRYEGVQHAALEADGALRLQIADQTVHLQRPEVYQQINGHRVSVASRYRLQQRGNSVELGFALADYDRRHELVIDPVLVYSTYLGGAASGSSDFSLGIAVDGSGNAYVTGYTNAADFPIAGAPLQPALSAASDAFVTKYSADGQTMLYSTYLGGTGADQAYAIAVNAAGRAFITGSTASNDFPLKSALYGKRAGDPEVSLSDVFVAELSVDGKSLVFSTYIGGGRGDIGKAIALDASGGIYVAGRTDSIYTTTDPVAEPENVSFPVISAAQAESGGNGNPDAFALKLTADGSALVYSTFIGGSQGEVSTSLAKMGLAIDGSGRAFVASDTKSADFPVSSGAAQTIFGGGQDAFLAVLSSDGKSFVYASFLGGAGNDVAHAVAVGTDGRAYVTGTTSSSNFPTSSAALDNALGGSSDAFLTVFAADGRSLTYSSYLGGAGSDEGRGLGIDSTGKIYVAGFTGSTTGFPVTADAVQSALAGSTDGFLCIFDSGPTSLTFSSFLGGSKTEQLYDLAVSSDGQAYVTGITQSADFKTQSPEQPALNGGTGIDGFVARIGSPTVASPGTLAFAAASANVQESAGSITLQVTRTGGSSGAVSVKYATANGSALAGADYTSSSGTLSWAAGDTAAKTISLAIVNDSTVEAEESFTVTLSDASGGAKLGSNVQATVSISDDDAAKPGVINLDRATITVGEDAGAVLFVAHRVGGSDGKVAVQYQTSDGEALAALDYMAASGKLVWADGDSADKSFVVTLINDDVHESDETFNVQLSKPFGGAVLGNPVATVVTIQDNDPPKPGKLQLDAVEYRAAENAGTVTLLVNRVEGSDGAVSVDYSTAAGSAAANVDYVAKTGTLSWVDGDSAPKSIVLQLIDDSRLEDEEQFTVNLRNAQGAATLGTQASATITIVDDETVPASSVQLSVANVTVDLQAGLATVVVPRSGNGQGAVSVAYSTVDGTALAGVDFTAQSGRLSWADGDTQARVIQIPLLSKPTDSKLFYVQLSSPSAGLSLPEPSSVDVKMAAVAASDSGGGGGALDPRVLLVMLLAALASWRQRAVR